MIKQWKVESDWQEPFLDELRRRGVDAKGRDEALRSIDDACVREDKSARELFGDPVAHGKEFPVSTTVDARAASQSRGRAIALALAGLVGMFFALLGWQGHVKDMSKVWGLNPTIWLVLGLVVAVAAAIADTALGAKADFSQGPGGRGATVLNRLLPWIIVALTLIGMLVVSMRHG